MDLFVIIYVKVLLEWVLNTFSVVVVFMFVSCVPGHKIENNCDPHVPHGKVIPILGAIQIKLNGIFSKKECQI